MIKTKLLLVSVLLALTVSVLGQTMTITNPVLNPPYQVATGTAVTFTWDAFGSPPNAIFTHNLMPVVNQGLPPDPSWAQHTNFTANGNGTYSITLNINNDSWVFGGLNTFIGWQYSNVLFIQTISSIEITANKTLICVDNDSVMFTAPAGTGYTYQWYGNGIAVSGATDSIYYAYSAGTYHCEVTVGTTVNTTNAITITNYEASFSGAVNGALMTLWANQNFASYQWYERTATGNFTAISGAVGNQHTVTITSNLMYYTYEGITTGGCAIEAPDRPIVDSLFTTPVATLYATPNSQGYICEGTPVAIAVNGNPGTYNWFLDNVQNSTSDSINIWGAGQNGTWYAEAECLFWPEITIASNNVVVNILNLITPNITGANYYDKFCAGDIIPMILTDEGYSYTWYVHDTLGVYGPGNIVSVPSSVYQHNFTVSTYVTIIAEYNGCSTEKLITLSGWETQNLYLSIDNYDQEYLCTDSTVNLYVPAWTASDYQDFQWFENIAGTWIMMAGDTSSILNVTQAGEYKVTAIPVSCATALIHSNPKTIYSYLEREPYIYPNQSDMCEGDTVILNMSGASNWFALQWLEADIQIGSNGYEREFIGMLNNSGMQTQEVFVYGGYRVSAKHNSCPNGLKVKSNIVFMKPTLNPEIILTSSMLEADKHIIEWDSTRHFVGCQNEPVSMTLNHTQYASISWRFLLYAGDDDYEPGTQFSTLDTVSTSMDAKWITAVVEDTTGCKGQSTPILLDTYVFLSPTITSYNNSELCGIGDSTLIHLSFTGNWAYFEWYHNGTLIPNSNNDSLWVNEEGMYTITAYPSLCPTFGYSSGVGPVVSYLYAEIIENDSLIYAMPEYGYYSYQWFFNGDSIDAPMPNTPWLIMKDSLMEGTYTVAVSNDSCFVLSDPFIWTGNGITEAEHNYIEVYPNPSTGIITVSTSRAQEIRSMSLFDLHGREIEQLEIVGKQTIDISNQASGLYFIQIISREGLKHYRKISKQ
jgi:hypothetical protein